MEFTCPNNLFFECSECGLCCGDTEEKIRHILLLEAEANKILTETSLPKQAFAKPISTKNPYCYEMKKNSEGKCFFLKDNQCTIYTSRPLICWFYPFKLKFNSEKNQYDFSFTVECPQIGSGKTLTRNDFKKLFLLAKERLP